MMKRQNLKIGLAVLAAVMIIGAVFGFKIYRDKLTVSLPDYPPIRKAIWLEQGWSQEQRERFHHADQGTQTLNIPYEWFVALEQPRLSLTGDVGRLSDPAYLDRYGFIPGATKGGHWPILGSCTVRLASIGWCSPNLQCTASTTRPS
jgi:hypothetical protein